MSNFELCIVISMFLLVGVCFWRCLVKNRCDKDLAEATIIKMDRETSEDYKVILERMDDFINQSFEELLLLNPEYIKLQNVSKIDQEKTKHKLVARVSANISPSLINKLTVVYNEKAVIRILAERCSMRVLDWGIEKNKAKYQVGNEDVLNDLKRGL